MFAKNTVQEIGKYPEIAKNALVSLGYIDDDIATDVDIQNVAKILQLSTDFRTSPKATIYSAAKISRRVSPENHLSAANIRTLIEDRSDDLINPRPGLIRSVIEKRENGQIAASQISVPDVVAWTQFLAAFEAMLENHLIEKDEKRPAGIYINLKSDNHAGVSIPEQQMRTVITVLKIITKGMTPEQKSQLLTLLNLEKS